MPRATAGIRRFLPRGTSLPPDLWRDRHRMVLGVLWFHVAAVPGFGVARGFPLWHSLAEAGVLAVAATVASRMTAWNQRVRAVAAVLGLLASSAILVHFAEGRIEMHFHFFVMLAVISLYQDWLSFLTAIAFVGLHHGVFGMVAPGEVFDHHGAVDGAWKWAGVHALFILAVSAAQVTTWRLAEEQRDGSEAALRASEHRFRALIEHATDAVAIVGLDGRVGYLSPSITAMTGWAVEHLAGRSVVDFVHPDDLASAGAVLAEARPGGPVVACEVRSRRTDGSWQRLEAQFRNLIDTPEIAGIVINLRDVTERRDLEARLEHQAFHDALTGLANRPLFLDRLERVLAGRAASGAAPFAVLFLDLDDFKTVNDGLGHAAGDAVLSETARRLESCLREVDVCARLGGDEFAVLLQDVTGSAVEAVTTRILAAVAEPLIVDQTLVELSASVGIAVVDGPDAGPDAAALLRNADLAMYRAKEEGKGRAALFRAGMDDAARDRLALKADLRRAVDAGEFVVHYQPIVDLATGTVVGAEALARWAHPVRGLIGPGSFIALAEETGAVTAIGRSVLAAACQEAGSWPATADRELTVNVNLSARQLQDPGLVHDVADALAGSGFPARRLTLEITESMLVDDPDAAAATLAELKALGVLLALDDFGTGYSSLRYLARFPVDVVKIDKSFVDGLDRTSEGDSRLVGAIVGLAASLGINAVAEGIEQADQAAALLGLGCTVGQGYLFARPLPAPDFRALLWPALSLGASAP